MRCRGKAQCIAAFVMKNPAFAAVPEGGVGTMSMSHASLSDPTSIRLENFTNASVPGVPSMDVDTHQSHRLCP